MSRKGELMKLARLLRSQAEGHGPTKRSLRQLADYYEREAQRLLEVAGRRDIRNPTGQRRASGSDSGGAAHKLGERHYYLCTKSGKQTLQRSCIKPWRLHFVIS